MRRGLHSQRRILLDYTLKHLQGRVQMFAICFKTHQKNVKALMDGRGVVSGGPHSKMLVPGCGWWVSGSPRRNSPGCTFENAHQALGQTQGPRAQSASVRPGCAVHSGVRPGLLTDTRPPPLSAAPPELHVARGCHRPHIWPIRNTNGESTCVVKVRHGTAVLLLTLAGPGPCSAGLGAVTAVTKVA